MKMDNNTCIDRGIRPGTQTINETTFLLFNIYQNIQSNSGKMRFFSFVLYDNNEEVLNLFPCYRKSDGKPGMYDIVNRRFYTNDGTGEFIVGPDAN